MRSMTGYGRADITVGPARYTFELKSLNRRQTEIALNLPPELAPLETRFRKTAAGGVSRGRLSVTLTAEPLETAAAERLRVDHALARQYVDALSELAANIDRPLPLTAEALLRAPGVFTLHTAPVDLAAVATPLDQTLGVALESLAESQRTEGAHLIADVRQRLATIRGCLDAIAELAPAVTENGRAALHRRLSDAGLALDLDDERLLKEIALLADRSDISEELTRIASHLTQFDTYLDSLEPVGRPLDFLCQELNRELNTAGSKAGHAGISHHIVTAKTELEKIREQVQNIQ